MTQEDGDRITGNPTGVDSDSEGCLVPLVIGAIVFIGILIGKFIL